MLAALLAAENRLSSMFVFFFVALLIVSPFGYRQVREVRRIRRERRGPTAGDASAEPGSPSSVASAPNDLARVIAAIAEAGRELAAEPDGERTVTVPASPTVEGRPAPAAVVDALLDDAVRRTGLAARAGDPSDAGRVLRLTRR